MKSAATGFIVSLCFAGATSFAAPTIWSPDNLADFNVGPGGDRIITFDAAAPAVPVVVGRTGFTGSLFSGMDFDCNGNLYGYVQTGAVGLYSINQSTGAATFIGSGGVLAGQIITDLAFDHGSGTMYGIGASSAVPNFNIYSINLGTGVATNLGSTTTGGFSALCTGLAIDAGGTFYAQDLVNDAEFSWAGPVGAAVLLPFQGFDANFAQGTTTDRTGAGVFYHCAFNAGAFLTELWTGTGPKSLVGVIGPFNGSTGLPEYETSDGAIKPNCGGFAINQSPGCPGNKTISATGATPGGPVAFLRSNNAGGFIIPGGVCAGTATGLAAPVTLIQIVNANGSGNASINGNVPQAACNRIHVQAIDGATCGTSNVIIIG